MMRMQRLDDQHVNDFNTRNSCAAAADHSVTMHHRSRPRETFHSAFADERPADRGRTAKNSSGRNGHRHTKRSPSERRFKCEQDGCEKMFFTRKDVKRHMVVHTGVRNFPCQNCQQRFGRKDHLVRHAKKSHNRDCRSSASSYSLASAPATFAPQSLTAASHASKMSRHMNPSLLSLSSVPSGPVSNLNPAACCTGNGQSSPSQSAQMLLLSQSHTSGPGAGPSYSSPCPSVQPVGAGGGDFASSAALMQHHHSQHASDPLAHHSLSASHSQSHLTVSPVQHAMAKSSFDGNGYHFLPVPSAGHFVSHSLMNPFVANSSRSLYTTPGPFSAMSGMTVDPHHHHHHHHSGPASGPGIPFPGENPALPHFNQAFH